MLVQLVHQLQQAGQLPADDSVQRLLQPNAAVDALGRPSPNVEIKVETESSSAASQQPPMFVIAKTESVEEKQPPYVYVDVAEDRSTETTRGSRRDARRGVEKTMKAANRDGGRSAKAAKAREAVASQSKPLPPHQNLPRRTRSTSPAVTDDPKLTKRCLVTVNRVESTAEKTTNAVGSSTSSTSNASDVSSSQKSRIDKLKNLKNQYISAEILSNQGRTDPTPPFCTSGAADSLKSVSDRQTQLPQENIMLNLLPSGLLTHIGARNIFSIFAQTVTGAGSLQEEPVAVAKPSDPLPGSIGALLQRSVNCGRDSNLSLRSMYLGYVSHNMEWLSLISAAFPGRTKTYCQCTFCPKVGDFPREIALHISRDHQELKFALNKLRPVAGPVLFIKCRHCNFVTVDSTLAWIHFDIHHGISEILDCSEHATTIDMSGPDMPETFIAIDDVMGSATAYVCFDCSAVNADADLTASALLMARHVTHHHPNSVNCNGNFVKVLMLTRMAGDPDSIKGSPTYRQAICDHEHVRGRREVYICLFCR